MALLRFLKSLNKYLSTINCNNMKKRTKTILYVLGGIFVAAQLYRPAKNNSNTNPGDILEKYPASASVQQTLKTACYDCHSNNTVYPWYAQIQPG